jgi:predicted acylesterase/phospholipase RssA
MRALVLSGGGARAVWQVGACHHLIAERGYWFDVIAGVSAGAVNAAALAHAHTPAGLPDELDHLRAVWFGIRGNDDVYRRRWLRALLHDVGPLRRLLTQEIDPARVAGSPIRLLIGYVDLLSGKYRTAGNDHATLVEAVMASCALPLVFPPVPLRHGLELGVDGGVRRAAPVADAVRALADAPDACREPHEVWVLGPEGRVRPGDVGNAPSSVRVRALHPREPLRGGRLAFDPPTIRAWYDDGLRTAREVVPTELAA